MSKYENIKSHYVSFSTSDVIEGIKKKLESVTQICSDYDLVFKETILNTAKRLMDYNIKDNSKIHVSPRFMLQFTIKNHGTVNSMKVNKFNTIGDLKLRKPFSKDWTLKLNDKILEDENTLSFYGLTNEIKIDFEVIKQDNHKIGRIKQKIASKFGIAVERQKPFSPAIILNDDNSTVDEYNLLDISCIDEPRNLTQINLEIIIDEAEISNRDSAISDGSSGYGSIAGSRNSLTEISKRDSAISDGSSEYGSRAGSRKSLYTVIETEIFNVEEIEKNFQNFQKSISNSVNFTSTDNVSFEDKQKAQTDLFSSCDSYCRTIQEVGRDPNLDDPVRVFKLIFAHLKKLQCELPNLGSLEERLQVFLLYELCNVYKPGMSFSYNNFFCLKNIFDKYKSMSTWKPICMATAILILYGGYQYRSYRNHRKAVLDIIQKEMERILERMEKKSAETHLGFTKESLIEALKLCFDSD